MDTECTLPHPDSPPICATIRVMLLHRLTTRYVSLEDRICLTGETDSDETVRLWLTRRLLDGLLPAVFRWLDKLGSDREQHAGTPRAAAGASGEASGPGVAASGGGEAAGGGETAAPKPPIRADRSARCRRRSPTAAPRTTSGTRARPRSPSPSSTGSNRRRDHSPSPGQWWSRRGK